MATYHDDAIYTFPFETDVALDFTRKQGFVDGDSIEDEDDTTGSRGGIAPPTFSDLFIDADESFGSDETTFEITLFQSIERAASIFSKAGFSYVSPLDSTQIVDTFLTTD